MNSKTILYVEDDDFSREVMSILMEDYPQYTLIMFPDSHAFDEKVAALPDNLALVLLDIHVPPIDGFEMLKQLRSNERFVNTPVLALTASVMNEEVNRLRTVGFDGAIAKPIDLSQFVSNIASVMNGKQIWSIIGA